MNPRMGAHGRSKRFLLAALVGAAAAVSMAAPAAAHSQTVTPPGQDPVVSGPIAAASQMVQSVGVLGSGW